MWADEDYDGVKVTETEIIGQKNLRLRLRLHLRSIFYYYSWEQYGNVKACDVIHAIGIYTPTLQLCCGWTMLYQLQGLFSVEWENIMFEKIKSVEAYYMQCQSIRSRLLIWV
jgi:hypothetical protein